MQAPDIVQRWEQAIRKSLSPSNSSNEEQLGLLFNNEMTTEDMVNARFNKMAEHTQGVISVSNK